MASLQQTDVKITELKLKNEYHEKRLTTDYFRIVWYYLAKETQKSIISAELGWYEATNNKHLQDQFIHYSLALETELYSIFFKEENVARTIDNYLKRCKDKDKSKLLPLKLNSLSVNSLYLSDMSILLSYIRDNEKSGQAIELKPLFEVYNSLPLPEDQRKLLIDKIFTDDLKEIYKERNNSVHRLNRPIDSLKLQEIRSRILGIGCDGYLMKIARIKRKLFDNMN